MQLIFCTNQNIGSIFTRWWTWCDYSHVALVCGDQVIEASFWSGVTQSSLKSFLAKYKKVLFGKVEGVDEIKAWAFAQKQRGKKYDYTALFGLWFKRDWQNDESWFCSEICTKALLEGGVCIVNTRVNRVTPQDMLQSPLVVPVEE